jgi:hypothetical protein
MSITQAPLQTFKLCVVLVAAFGAAGCLPMITHSPRVESGAQSAVMGGIGIVRLDSGVDSTKHGTVPFPTGAFRGGYGFHSSTNPGLPGLEGAIQLALPTIDVLADLYVEMPRPWFGELDVGAGSAYSGLAFPGPTFYVQAGRQAGDRYYVYTTQAVNWFRQSHDVWHTSWQPTLAMEVLSQGSQRRFFFITANIGPRCGNCFVEPWFGIQFRRARFLIGTGLSPMIASRRYATEARHH